MERAHVVPVRCARAVPHVTCKGETGFRDRLKIFPLKPAEPLPLSGSRREQDHCPDCLT